ncbi:ArsR/SmtB family transcription factor [Magnetospirillum aberrantis]|nr:metalloregulator ArsR/SmtB family transcription factor [Magnetospirillum aberrantis]
MTHIGMNEGIEALRRARLTPTPQRVTVAGLVFSGPTLALTARELQDRAVDADLYLSPKEAEDALAELRSAGVLPLMLEGRRRAPLDLTRAARLLQAMGNPHRLRVLRELSDGERCAGDLGRATGLQPSALSQHLSRLRADGLVHCRRVGSHIYYSLAGDAATAVLRSLAA